MDQWEVKKCNGEEIWFENDMWYIGDSISAYADTPEQIADARLAATAPQLLAACKAFVEAWEKSQLEKIDVALKMAKEAIEQTKEKYDHY